MRLETARSAAELPVRTCGCSFCTKHRPRYTSDPAGRVTIEIDDEANVSRYRFGLSLADFLVCRRCGVFVAAYEPGRAVVNIEALDDAAAFTTPATQFTDYDREDVAARTARRARAWSPATLHVGA